MVLWGWHMLSLMQPPIPVRTRVKFQTHIASAESTLHEPLQGGHGRQDATSYAYWQRMEITSEQWTGLAQHARERNLLFLSSAFPLPAVLEHNPADWEDLDG